jgi:hypothetical protein
MKSHDLARQERQYRLQPFRFFLGMAASVLLGAIAAGAVTMITWAICIEDKAFHCWDIGFGSYWTDIHSHANAGDTLLPGWTWEQLQVVRFHYLVAFWLVWPLISGILFWILHKYGLSRDRSRQ